MRGPSRNQASICFKARASAPRARHLTPAAYVAGGVDGTGGAARSDSDDVRQAGRDVGLASRTLSPASHLLGRGERAGGRAGCAAACWASQRAQAATASGGRREEWAHARLLRVHLCSTRHLALRLACLPCTPATPLERRDTRRRWQGQSAANLLRHAASHLRRIAVVPKWLACSWHILPAKGAAVQGCSCRRMASCRLAGGRRREVPAPAARACSLWRCTLKCSTCIIDHFQRNPALPVHAPSCGHDGLANSRPLRAAGARSSCSRGRRCE